ncbi:MAG: LCP family protein [Aeromicrobium sp.]
MPSATLVIEGSMSHKASILGRGYADRHLDSARVRFRRALTLCLMTIVAPGSAQLAVGNKSVGRAALAVWAALLGGIGYLAVTARIDRKQIFTLLTDSDALLIARAGIVVIAALWLMLFIDAWRLGSPFRLNFGRAAVVTAVNAAIVASAVGSTAYASQLIHVQNVVVKKVFKETEKSAPLKGRYNILLLGSDSGKGRMGLRPDSMTVASVDAETGKTVLVSLPRNLQNVPFPLDSPMHKAYPNGFNCGSVCLLNAVHTYASNRSDLYPGSKDPGLNAQIDAISGVTGLKINYYIMINMKGFRSLVNAVDGVTVNVHTRIAMFGHDDAYINKYIEPGVQKLDGKQALWFARSRVQSDDYTRMARQKCLMSDMLHELSPQTVLLNATKILTSGEELLSTTIPRSELPQFADLALKSRREKVATVSLVPPKVNTVHPDFVLIKKMINDAIQKSEETSAGDSKSDKSEANSTDDLESAC